MFSYTFTIIFRIPTGRKEREKSIKLRIERKKTYQVNASSSHSSEEEEKKRNDTNQIAEVFSVFELT